MMSSKSRYSQMNILQLRVELANYIKSNEKIVPDVDKICKAYIAGPWFTPKDKDVMQYIQSELNKYRKEGIEAYLPIEHTAPSPERTFKDNLYAIECSDEIIALIMSKDVGTAMEIGYAKAIGKTIVLVVYDESCLKYKTNIMLAYASDIVITLEELIPYLLGAYVSPLQIEDTWEGKE